MCGNSSVWAKIAFAVILIAFILYIVGFATASWMVYQTETTSIRVGLWKMKSCVGTSCSEDDISGSLQSDMFTATQGCSILAFLLFLAAVVAVGAYIFVGAAKGPCMAMTAMILCFSACFLAFLAMIFWVSYVSDPYVVSYSLGLTVIAAILALIAGALLLPDVLDDRGGPSKGSRVSSPPNSRFMMR